MSLSRVYYVEADPDDALRIAGAFPGTGYEVLLFAHPVALFHRLRSDELLPSLIILDIHLPAMDALEALRLLKAEPKFARIPVALLVGSPEPARTQPRKQLHLLKPDQFPFYESIVARLLDKAGPRAGRPAVAPAVHECVIPREMAAHPSIRRLNERTREDLRRIRKIG
ncbi:response regulator [Flaviaesturariibacter terrae]